MEVWNFPTALSKVSATNMSCSLYFKVLNISCTRRGYREELYWENYERTFWNQYRIPQCTIHSEILLAEQIAYHSSPPESPSNEHVLVRDSSRRLFRARYARRFDTARARGPFCTSRSQYSTTCRNGTPQNVAPRSLRCTLQQHRDGFINFSCQLQIPSAVRRGDDRR